jgi:fluoride exporter
MHVAAQITLVALGSALGGLTRWGVGLGFQRWLGTAFPWGTLFINITGSFFLGWLATVITERYVRGAETWLEADHLRLLLGVGFTGAYTTFSTFEYEAHHLLQGGENLKSLAYLIGSVALGLLAVRLGIMLGRTSA